MPMPFGSSDAGEAEHNGSSSWVFLQSVLNDVEADIITGWLETNEVPTMRRYPGYSSLAKIYTGSSFGVEIYVPAHLVEKACDLLYQAGEENKK